VTINVGANASHLYDAVAGVFVATNVTGNVSVTIAPDAAVVLAQCPAAGVISQAGQKLLDSGIVIDYWNATKDTDGDGLPDWWESLYYGNATNALPQTIAANGFSNLQCYWLGLDPNNPLSTFKTQVVMQSGTGYPANLLEFRRRKDLHRGVRQQPRSTHSFHASVDCHRDQCACGCRRAQKRLWTIIL
jgi:hypothetical protein